MNLDLLLQQARDLRQSGQGQRVRDILLPLSDYQGGALEVAQIGIEMNFAGLFARAEKMLERGLAQNGITGFSLYIAYNELCAAKYATGKYREAHALFRQTRTMRDDVIAHLYNWSSDQDFLGQIRSKFLGDKPVAGKSILVAHEGGFGDLVMHSRYLRALKQDGARTILVETPPSAAGIFAADPSITEIFDVKSALDQADAITWNFDLFARYQPDPFLKPSGGVLPLFPHNTALPQSLQSQLDAGAHQLRIGLLTASTSRVRHDPFRAVPLPDLAPLFEAARFRDIRFYDLNQGERTESDLATVKKYGIVELGPALENFAQTAAVLRGLDLLISIDTGPAHLAGALKRPTWLLLSAACDSRWHDDPHATPWYDNLRLYRQQKLGDWTSPIQAMIADLPHAP